MSRKAIIPSYVLDSAGDISTNYTSPVTDVQYLDGLSYLLSWSSLNGTGTITVQGSNYDPTPGATQVWSNLDLDPVSLSGATGNALLNIGSVYFQKIRLVYAPGTATAGALKTVVTAKGQA